MGGINAGEFTDHGPADNIEECMGYCCESKECDLAFMIDKDCYGVKCKDPSNCKTRPARPTKYRPIIAFKKSSESGKIQNFDLCSFEIRLDTQCNEYIRIDAIYFISLWYLPKLC